MADETAEELFGLFKELVMEHLQDFRGNGLFVRGLEALLAVLEPDHIEHVADH